jgi:hypothetical protein
MSTKKLSIPTDPKLLETDFLTHQRVRLEHLLRTLLTAGSGDITSRLTPPENRFQLGDVVRSLKKLDMGTYGFSDYSGRPISREHLENVPEAILTIEEAASRGRFEED